MASPLIFNSLPLSLPTRTARTSFRPPQHVPLCKGLHISRKARRLTTGVVTRAGPPSITTTLLAFTLPLALLLLTVFASIRVADKLEEKFLEELILQQAMKEADDDDDDDDEEEEEEEEEDGDNEDDIETFLEEKAKEVVLPRARNRPKREA